MSTYRIIKLRFFWLNWELARKWGGSIMLLPFFCSSIPLNYLLKRIIFEIKPVFFGFCGFYGNFFGICGKDF